MLTDRNSVPNDPEQAVDFLIARFDKQTKMHEKDPKNNSAPSYLFPQLLPHLRALGWAFAWGRQGEGVHVAPWANKPVEEGGVMITGKKGYCDTKANADTMLLNRDFFQDQHKVIEYIRGHGFTRVDSASSATAQRERRRHGAAAPVVDAAEAPEVQPRAKARAKPTSGGAGAGAAAGPTLSEDEQAIVDHYGSLKCNAMGAIDADFCPDHLALREAALPPNYPPLDLNQFGPVWKFMTYNNLNWRWIYSGDSVVHTRHPHIQSKNDLQRFTEGVDYFRSEQALLVFVHGQFTAHGDNTDAFVKLAQAAVRVSKEVYLQLTRAYASTASASVAGRKRDREVIGASSAASAPLSGAESPSAPRVRGALSGSPRTYAQKERKRPCSEDRRLGKERRLLSLFCSSSPSTSGPDDHEEQDEEEEGEDYDEEKEEVEGKEGEDEEPQLQAASAERCRKLEEERVHAGAAVVEQERGLLEQRRRADGEAAEQQRVVVQADFVAGRHNGGLVTGRQLVNSVGLDLLPQDGAGSQAGQKRDRPSGGVGGAEGNRARKKQRGSAQDGTGDDDADDDDGGDDGGDEYDGWYDDDCGRYDSDGGRRGGRPPIFKH
jgi:hypothetical protein